MTVSSSIESPVVAATRQAQSTITFNPPPAEVVDLVHRKDDTEEACRARLSKYHSETTPIVPFYDDKGILRRVDGVGHPDEVTERITTVLAN